MNNKTSAVFMAVFLVMAAGLCHANDGWQSSITVSSDNASNRLAFGQNTAATDQQDGFYDVPALFSGSLQAAFSDGDGALWRDIKASGNAEPKEWRLQVSSGSDEAIEISWDKNNLPGNLRVELQDVETGRVIDMKEFSNYALGNRSAGELIIEVTNL